MSAYKKLNTQDAYISTYTSRKSWVASGSQYRELGINNIKGLNGYSHDTSFSDDMFVAGNQSVTSSTAFNSKLIYKSIEHLYYTDFDQGILTTTSSYENYLQSSYEVSGSRYLNDRVAIFSLPKEMYGTHIEPYSISILPDLSNGNNDGTGSFDNYIDNNYTTDLGVDSVLTEDNQYIENTDFLFGSDNPNCVLLNQDYISDEGDYVDESQSEYLDHTNESKNCNEIIDDGEGRLYFKYSSPRSYVGNVIYTHGQLIITDETVAMYYNSYFNALLKWKSNVPIFTHNYHCRVKSNELNYSQNKTTLQTVDGAVLPFVTGSNFNPYFTSVGLYNDSNELIAVAKVGRPTPKSTETDMAIVLKLDMNFGSNRNKLGYIEETVVEDNLPPCQLFFTFRNYRTQSGAGTNWNGDLRNGTPRENRYYGDLGSYDLIQKEYSTTFIDNKAVEGNNATGEWRLADQYRGSLRNERVSCYVDVTVNKTISLATGYPIYTFEYFGGQGSNPGNPITYTPTNSSDRGIEFFREILRSYLLANRTSCDYDGRTLNLEEGTGVAGFVGGYENI